MRGAAATLRMPDFLSDAIQPVPVELAWRVLIRLVIAMIAGGVVTLIYRLTRAADETAPSFTVTLVLLSILIAMVTQVIGDNIARAFSLVGRALDRPVPHRRPRYAGHRLRDLRGGGGDGGRRRASGPGGQRPGRDRVRRVRDAARAWWRRRCGTIRSC